MLIYQIQLSDFMGANNCSPQKNLLTMIEICLLLGLGLVLPTDCVGSLIVTYTFIVTFVVYIVGWTIHGFVAVSNWDKPSVDFPPMGPHYDDSEEFFIVDMIRGEDN